MFELINKINDSNIIIVGAIAIPVYLLAFYFLHKIGMLTRISRAINSIFYSESSYNSSESTARRINRLERQVSNVLSLQSDKAFQAQREPLERALADHLSKSLPTMIETKLNEVRALDLSIDSLIKNAVDESVYSYLSKVDPSKLIADRSEHLRIEDRSLRQEILERTILEQMLSAGRLKSVMINLFIIFNIGILSTYLIYGPSLGDRAITAIIGLYVSLAAFIVYIYRTSNFRSSILLALREDAKKYYDADEYIRRLKPGAAPTDRDLEVLKLLTLNRAEREKMAAHPYEVILKGVHNSNIQLKGGKMLSASKVEKKAKAE